MRKQFLRHALITSLNLGTSSTENIEKLLKYDTEEVRQLLSLEQKEVIFNDKVISPKEYGKQLLTKKRKR